MAEESKAFLVDEYLKDLERRIAATKEMYSGTYKDEALILTCCYIDSIASQYYWPNTATGENFSKILINLGGNIYFKHIHVNYFLKKLPKKLFLDKIEDIELKLKPLASALIEPELVESTIMSLGLNNNQRSWIKANLHKSSIAAIAYERVRCEGVHDVWAMDLNFGNTKFNGSTCPTIDFNLLSAALDCVLAAIRTQCMEKTCWPRELNP